VFAADANAVATQTFVTAVAAALGVVGLCKLDAAAFDALGFHTVFRIAIDAEVVIAFALDTLALIALPVATAERIGRLAVISRMAKMKVARFR